jgi:tetraacyldisaccharide 4'-kinase
MKEMMSKMNNWQRIWNDDGSGSRYSPVKTITYILSLLYRLIINFRNRLYDHKLLKEVKLTCPVISIGNITVGGTGKTPCVIWLAQMLQQRGYRPVVLSRGYGGRNSQPVNIVTDGDKILLSGTVAGDEPLLIARSLKGIPVITGPDRILTGRVAVNNFGANVLICDDAFQHRRLYRDINIVLLDSSSPLGNGHLLPRGSLREPATALRRASVLIATRSAEATKKSDLIGKLAQAGNIPVFHSNHRSAGIVRGDYSVQLPPDMLEGKKICAFAGIGEPSSFKKSILAAGAQIMSFDIFPDHHRYSRTEVKKINDHFFQSGADLLLTTEKDGMRLQRYTEFLRTIYLMRIVMEIVPDRKSLENYILEKLAAGQGAGTF